MPRVVKILIKETITGSVFVVVMLVFVSHWSAPV